MFSDVHRHLVLCMKPLHGHKPRFRQIVVIKTDVFELRILEGEAVQLDQQDRQCSISRDPCARGSGTGGCARGKGIYRERSERLARV